MIAFFLSLPQHTYPASRQISALRVRFLFFKASLFLFYQLMPDSEAHGLSTKSVSPLTLVIPVFGFRRAGRRNTGISFNTFIQTHDPR